jgi:hypothetical protein
VVRRDGVITGRRAFIACAETDPGESGNDDYDKFSGAGILLPQFRPGTFVKFLRGNSRCIDVSLPSPWLRACLAALTLGGKTAASRQEPARQGPQPSQTQELLTDAAIIAAIIGASIASYRAMGKPCACPEDRMRNGNKCGGNNAWSRSGGYEPLCYPTDVTTAMIDDYRATKKFPRLRGVRR